MSNNELLLALSEMLDKKLYASLEPMKKDISDIKNEMQKINVTIENEIKLDIKLLAENYLPSVTRYEKALMETESIKADIELLKRLLLNIVKNFKKFHNFKRGQTYLSFSFYG